MVVEATVMLIVEFPVPVIEVGLKPTVTPVGTPEAVSATAELNPPVTVLVIVELPEFPCKIVTDDGDAESEKPATGGPDSAVIRAGFGLPQPVTRSYPVVVE